jgi:FMN phosphatase YigB (HAD superfamily)
MIGPAGIQAVTFDFWNTLVADGGNAGVDHRRAAWTGVLEDAGFAVERGALDAAMAASWEKFLGSWKTNEQYTHVEAAVDILDQLGYDVPPDVHDRLIASYTYSVDTMPSLTEGIGDCLDALKAAGVRLGIICDVGMTPSTALRAILEHNGTDIAGALAADWNAVRYTGAFDDDASEGPEATWVVASHADLPGVLGFA